MLKRLKNWWKPCHADPLWGCVWEYRFPLLGWLLGEAHYRLIHKPKCHVSYWLKYRRFAP